MKMKRRSLIAAAGAAAVLPAPWLALAQGSGEVIVATTGGLMTNSLQAHFYKRFEAETGIKVRAVAIELPDQWARAVAGARSGTVPFDVVTATPPDMIQHAEILHTLDCAGMPGIVANALPNSKAQSQLQAKQKHHLNGRLPRTRWKIAPMLPHKQQNRPRHTKDRA